MVTRNRLFAEFFSINHSEYSHRRSSGGPPILEENAARRRLRTSEERKNEENEEEEDSSLYHLLGSRCRCDKLMLLGTATPTATLRIISIPCPSIVGIVPYRRVASRRVDSSPRSRWNAVSRFRNAFTLAHCRSIMNIYASLLHAGESVVPLNSR